MHEEVFQGSEMKTHTPHPSSWMGYISQVKEIINRQLSEKEYSILMNGYINSFSVEQMVIKLEEK